MTESVKGKTVAEATQLFRTFHDMLTGVAEEQGWTSASWWSSRASASTRCASSARPWPGTR